MYIYIYIYMYIYIYIYGSGCHETRPVRKLVTGGRWDAATRPEWSFDAERGSNGACPGLDLCAKAFRRLSGVAGSRHALPVTRTQVPGGFLRRVGSQIPGRVGR